MVAGLLGCRADVSAVHGTPHRLRSLDGLRGVAALVVLVHHCALTDPVLDAAQRGDPAPGWARWWADGPVQLLWSGPVAVAVFFVLSGFVLSLPGAVGESTPRYWVRRLVRLYLPVWAALLLAYGLAAAVPRVARTGQSAWMAVHHEPLSALTALNDAVVLRGVTWVDSPLWSLRWEIFFSLLLPLLLPAVRRLARTGRGAAAVLVALLVGIALGGALGVNALLHLPVFGVGVVLAQHREALAARLAATTRARWLALLVGTLLLLDAGGLGLDLGPVEDALVAAGAGLLVVVCLAPRAAGFGRLRVVRAAAAVSFGLYLVHEPIVVSAATLFPTLPPLALLAAVAVPVAVAAWLMTVLVERPSRRIAGWTAAHVPARTRTEIPA